MERVAQSGFGSPHKTIARCRIVYTSTSIKWIVRFVNAASSSLSDLDEVRRRTLEIAGQGRLQEAIDLLIQIIATIRDDNTALTARLHTALRALYGRKGEKIDVDQLRLALEQLDGEVPDAAKPKDTETEPRKPPRSKPGHTRRPLPAHLPREKKVILVPETLRSCDVCGGQKRTFGFARSEVLEFRPAMLVIVDLEAEKVVCPTCEAGVVQADLDKVIDKGRPGPGLVAKLIVSKIADGLPVERQVKEIERLGVSLPPSTLGDWFSWGLDMLAPLGQRLMSRVVATPYIQGDDTGLKVLDPALKPAVKRGHMWCFVGYPQTGPRIVAFQYAPSWHAPHAAKMLEGFKGTLQGDGYAGFNTLGQTSDAAVDALVPDERRLGCGMHIRRKFEAAFEAKDARGAIALGFFRKLYALEAQCREATAVERLAVRQTQSLPIVDEMYDWVAMLAPKVVPGTLLAKAMTYAVNQEHRWRRCFDDGRFHIDNGEPERQIRLVASGRKAFLFAGSDAGAARLATGYALVANCRILRINEWEYLNDVLEKIALGWDNRRLDELLPDAWARARAPATDPPPDVLR